MTRARTPMASVRFDGMSRTACRQCDADVATESSVSMQRLTGQRYSASLEWSHVRARTRQRS